MLTKIKDKYLEFSAFIILMLWMISPLVEYFFKLGYRHLYTKYFTTTIYIIGSLKTKNNSKDSETVKSANLASKILKASVRALYLKLFSQ